MIPRIVLFLPLALAAVGSSHAQTPDTLRAPGISLGVVDTVIVTGNTKTETYVILNEMTLTRGSVATEEAIEYDRNRIYSLGLFTRVDITFDTLGTVKFLSVSVSERWHLIPLLIFGFRDGDVKKPYFGAGFLHNNFRGRNQKLYASLILGYNPSASFSYSDPLLDRERRLTFSTGLSFERIHNLSQQEALAYGDYDEQHYNISASLGHRINIYETITAIFGFRVITVSDYRPGRTVSTSGRDAFPLATLTYTRDTRDLAEYATRGSFLNFYATSNGLALAAVGYSRFGVDARKYLELPANFTLAGRLFGTAVAGGEVPPYGRAYFGYAERIRGYFSTVLEGEDQVGGTLELRFALLKPRVIHFTAIPLPPEFVYWRFGLSLTTFADVGTTWFRGQSLTWNSFSSGYGVGLDILLPYSFIVRLQYAWNDYGHGQFILDLRRPM